MPPGAIAYLALAAFGSGISLRVNDAMLPRLATEFGVSLGSASQVIGWFAIAYGLSQLFFGPIGDRYGKYRVIAWATLACSLTALACAAAPDFDALRIARVAAGATAAAVIPLSMAWIGDVVPYTGRQPALARFLIGQILGLSAGVWLGGVAAEHLSWRAPYIAIAVLFAAVGMALLAMQRRLPARARSARRTPGGVISRTIAEFGGVLALPWARVVLALVFFEGMGLYGPFAFIATHVHRAFGLSLSAAGALTMAYGGGGFVFAVGSRRLVARLGESGLVAWGGVLMTLSLLTVAFAPAWGWALGGCFLLGLGFYMVHNTLQVNATQMAPARRGAAVAAFASCFFLGQSVGVASGGLWVGAIGTRGILAVGSGVVALVAAAFVALRRARPDEPAVLS
ncbi:MAG: MFS transporter [Pseudomonadota bacterium]|nr:MFS transporter [Pseudomonadota bacterium]